MHGVRGFDCSDCAQPHYQQVNADEEAVVEDILKSNLALRLQKGQRAAFDRIDGVLLADDVEVIPAPEAD